MTKLSKAIAPDWIFPSFYHQVSKKLLPPTPESKQFLNALWPASYNYDSPLCPIFLAECANLQILNKRTTWLIRDGLVPLSWFFELHPLPPKNFDTLLLISEKIAGYVPTSWRKHFGCYRLVCKKSAGYSEKNKSLFISSLVVEGFCSLEALREQCTLLDRWAMSKSIPKTESIQAFFPVHSDLSSNFAAQFISEATTAIGRPLECLDWAKFNGSESLSGYYMMEFNDSMLCCDSYFSHALLARGATLLDPSLQLHSQSKIEAGAVYVELSPFHGMVVKKSIGKKSQFETALRTKNSMSTHYQKYNRAMQSKANTRYPWPQWLMEWGHDHKPVAK